MLFLSNQNKHAACGDALCVSLSYYITYVMKRVCVYMHECKGM